MSHEFEIQPVAERALSLTHVPAFRVWLATRPDLWSAGPDIQAEVYAGWVKLDATETRGSAV